MNEHQGFGFYMFFFATSSLYNLYGVARKEEQLAQEKLDFLIKAKKFNKNLKGLGQRMFGSVTGTIRCNNPEEIEDPSTGIE